MRRAGAWLLIVAGVAMAVAAFFVAATTIAATLWPVFAAGFGLVVLGIIVLAIGWRERRER